MRVLDETDRRAVSADKSIHGCTETLPWFSVEIRSKALLGSKSIIFPSWVIDLTNNAVGGEMAA